MIRPLTKIKSGRYRSADGRWEFVRDPLDDRCWIMYADGDEVAYDVAGSLDVAVTVAGRVKLSPPGDEVSLR